MGTQLAPDRMIARLAVRQAGIVSFDQLLRMGLSRRQIRRRADAGRLHQLHRGVYAVGHPLSGAKDGGGRPCSRWEMTPF
jgi:predicted transcriptional regulator of viral defense system